MTGLEVLRAQPSGARSYAVTNVETDEPRPLAAGAVPSHAAPAALLRCPSGCRCHGHKTDFPEPLLVVRWPNERTR